MKDRANKGIYFNVMRDYLPILEKCIKEGLWLKHQGTWWGPYDWANEFGVSWMTNTFNPELCDPNVLLREGYGIIQRQRQNGVQEDELSEKIKRCESFERQIKEYELAQKNRKLAESIRSGLWVR